MKNVKILVYRFLVVLLFVTSLCPDVDGGAGVIMHPDHHQDLATWPTDPVDHPESGSLQLIAYGNGNGTYANAIRLQTRSDVNTVADRMVVKGSSVTIYGNLQATGTITSSNHISSTAALNWGSISRQSSATKTMTVTGAAVGDNCYVSPNGTITAGCSWCAWISAANTVTIQMVNATASSVDPDSTGRTWRASVWHY
jgi:hypothetical protein